jgi:type IV pilus assembly protein PilF
MAPKSVFSAVRAWAAWAALAGLLSLAACSAPATRSAVEAGASQEKVTVASAAHRRAGLRLALAKAYYQQGQDEVALDQLRQALASQPDLVPALNLRGLVHLRLGQWPQAERSLQQALALAPEDADVAHNLAWTLCQQPQTQPQTQAQYKDMAALFLRALAQPGYAHAARSWAALGVCQQRAARLPQAEASLAQAWRLEPANLSVAVLLAQLHVEQGQWPQASQVLEQAHARLPASAQSLWLAVRAARKLDNQALFRQRAEQLRQEFGRSPQALALDKGLFDE